MEELLAVIGAWFASGAWWALLVDLALPFAAILVPTFIALRLASAERQAAEKYRAEREAREREERISVGIDHAAAAMEYLAEAAYQTDFREAARIRFLSARELGKIKHNLGPENNAAWLWIVEELQTVAGGLEDTDHNGLPVLMEKIVHRSGRFANVLSDWRMDEIGQDWFASAEHPPLSETKLLVDDDTDDGR